jgi:phosphatidylglycerol:prolipoprotein diacylglycerol transferase
MITIGIDPILFSIGHLHIRWYSLIVITAIVIGLWIVTREATRKGFKKDDILDIAIWVILGGMIGARLFHVLDHWQMFANRSRFISGKVFSQALLAV